MPKVRQIATRADRLACDQTTTDEIPANVGSRTAAGHRLRAMPKLAIGALAALTIAAFAQGALAQQRVETPPVAPAQLSTDPDTYQTSLDSLGISGYASSLSVRPGETVDIKVSTKSAKFTSDLVRVIHGDADPLGPGIKETKIDVPGNGEHDGKYQLLPIGSYVAVKNQPALDPASSFTITAWIAPSTIPGSNLNKLAQRRTPVGTPRPQGIVTKWDNVKGTGYGLFVEDDGSLALWIAGEGGKVEKLRTGVKMNPFTPSLRSVESFPSMRPMMTGFTTWYFVAASFDANTKKITLYQIPLKAYQNAGTEKVLVSDSTVTALAHNDASLLIGAGWDAGQPNGVAKGGLFNGKIDGPRLYGRVLSPAEIDQIRNGRAVEGAIAAWDFSKLPEGENVIDTAGGNNGVTVNLPVRAVTSHSWKDGVMDHKSNPAMYNAIYFHEDDLGDSKWETSVRYTIPENAKSGLYAARLKAGDNIYHVAFTVRPKANEHADIAFLVPTFSYLAYGGTGKNFAPYAASQYNPHNDGSGVVYSSSLRPIGNMRSYATGMKGEGRPWQYEADTHLTDWLEQTGYNIDYITDHDVHREGVALLKNYKAVLTGSHPEYISAQIWQAFEEWLNGGGRLMYTGGNGFYWVTTLSANGTYTELRRHDGTESWQASPGEYFHSTTGEFGGLWRYRGYAPQELVGVGFTAQGFASLAGAGTYGRPYQIADQGRGPGGSWVFKGVKTDGPIGDFTSLQGPGGPGGEELDRVEYALGTPANTLVLATSTGFGDEYVHVVEEVHTSNLMQGGKVNPLVRADMALMYYPNGGAVWSSSSISWDGSLFYNNYDNDVARITKNVLDMFVSGAPLPAAPAFAK